MVARTAFGYVLVQFLTGGSSLNSKAEAALGVLARKIKVGAVITCTGYAANNPVLALRRAAVVADFLSKRVLIRVTLRSVTNGLDGWTTVTS
jgi:outer membrane protein OmpA-like peptidoglycan-associated protein